MVDLRNHLFATLEALQDEDHPMDIARAIAIRDVAQVLVNSAKVEVDHMRVTGRRSALEFIPLTDADALEHEPTKLSGMKQ